MNLIRDICSYRQPSLELVAHHEAGHAVLQTILLWQPDRLVIERRGASVGRAALRLPAPRLLATREAKIAVGRIALAGFAAEDLFLGHPSRLVGFFLSCAAVHPPEGDIVDGELDQDIAARMLRALGHDGIRDRRRELDREYQVARARLLAHWPAVHALARALDRATELDRRGIAEVLLPFNLTRNGGAADGS